MYMSIYIYYIYIYYIEIYIYIYIYIQHNNKTSEIHQSNSDRTWPKTT